MGNAVCSRVLIVIILAASLGVFAQAEDSASRDQLEQRVGSTTGAEKKDALIDLVERIQLQEPQRAIELGNEADFLLQQFPDADGEFRLAVALARAYRSQHDSASTEKWVTRATTLAERSGRLRDVWMVQLVTARLYGLQERWEDALVVLESAHEMAGDLDEEAMVRTLTRKSRVQLELDQLLESFRSLFEAKRRHEAAAPGTISKTISAHLENELGSAYWRLDLCSRAIPHYQRARELWADSKRQSAIALQNIAACYAIMEEHEQSLALHHEALEMSEEIDDVTGIVQIRSNIAYSLIELGRVEEALPYARSGLDVALQMDGELWESWLRTTLARALVHTGKPKEALEQIQQAQPIARRVDRRPLSRKVHRVSAEIYAAVGDHETAFQHQESLREIEKEFDAEKRAQIGDLQAQVESALSELRIAELDSLHRRERLRGQIALGAGIAAILFAGVVLFGWRRQRRANSDLRQTNRKLEATYADLAAKTALAQSQNEELTVLRGLLRICSSCKKIHDDAGEWTQIEKYIDTHSEARFTHGFCPQCAERYLNDPQATPVVPR